MFGESYEATCNVAISKKDIAAVVSARLPWRACTCSEILHQDGRSRADAV